MTAYTITRECANQNSDGFFVYVVRFGDKYLATYDTAFEAEGHVALCQEVDKEHELFIKEVRDWAHANYGRSFGASSIIECFTDEDIIRQFKSLDDVIAHASLLDDVHRDITNV